MSNTQRVVLVGMLTALNTASRVALVFLPNIKPVTSIIIVATLYFGLQFGIELSITTALVSGIILGFGIWIPFQILAWVIISVISHFLGRITKSEGIMYGWIFLSGYVFGFIVSLDKLLFMGPRPFLIYYINGLLFDTYHGFGNILFFPLAWKVIDTAYTTVFKESFN